MRTITLFGRLFDLNCHCLDVVLCVLLSWNWRDFYLEGVLANRGVGGVPVEGNVSCRIEGAIPQPSPALKIVVISSGHHDISMAVIIQISQRTSEDAILPGSGVKI